LLERTRQIALLDAETTPVDKKRVNSCVLKQPLFEGVQQQKNPTKNPGNTLSDALLKSRFQDFAARSFFETALRVV